MRVTVKLYALLSQYLPRDAVDQTVTVEVAEAATVQTVLGNFSVPPSDCHLLLVNGCFVVPGQRDTHVLKDGDAMAVWPPIAGG